MSHNQNCDQSSCNHTQNFGCEQTLDEIEFENSIFNACVIGDIEKIRSLILKKGIDLVNQQDKSGFSCLHYAARNNHLEICKLLLKTYNASPNLKTYSCQSTPLHRAAYMGNQEIVKLLLDNKAKPCEKTCDGKTALHKCVEQYVSKNYLNDLKKKQFVQTIKLLIDYDKNLLNEKDNNSKTPLDICPHLKEFI
jgi:ankyrin repeat protein